MIISRPSRFAPILLAATFAVSGAAFAQTAGAYTVTNILSDGSVPAAATDANFINPWGVSASGTWWISANGSGFNFVVPSTGAIAFKVIVPAPNGTSNGSPTGSVTTGGATGLVLPNGTKASFLFSTDDGTISGWNGKLGTANALSQIVVNNSAANASYNGLAILNTSSGSFVLAPNFGAASKVEVYDSSFKPTQLAGSFTDPNLPAAYSPYAIHILGSQIFVTYTVRTPSAPYNEVSGPGNGLVDIFDFTGNFVSRAITGGNLNNPWGVAYAPANFGIYSNDLLVGNFGDGVINVYDPKSFAFLGQLMDGKGQTLVYQSLWELLAAGTTVTGTTSVSGGIPGTVYFTAGLANQAHGLFAAIANDSTTAGTPAFGAFASSSNITLGVGASTQVALSIAPTYNFSGSVTLSCPSPPTGVTCTFSPANLAVVGTAPSTSSVIIQTTKAAASLSRPARLREVAYALMLPLFGLLALRRRSQSLRILSLALFLFASLTLVGGCGGYTPGTVHTPTGAQVVNITATAGTQTRTIPINLNVQ